jgi:murein DD-endopeptidase MepM/ murein hydrolase activator NlpD
MRFRLTDLAFLGGAAVLMLSTPAVARSPAAELASADELSGEAAPSPPVHITVGRAADLQGRPAYAVRTGLAESGSEIAFSYVRPRFSAATGAIVGTIPSGMPLSARALTSGFGMRVNPVTGVYAEHAGIDLAAPAGTPIVATGDGVVGRAGWDGGYGLMVALEHGGGVETRYGHMSQIAVAPGEQVHRGEVIGYVGSTGRSTGSHVHYETRINGHPVNPLRR